ncbi:MAG: UDP-glucose 4-epimerase GalE [Alphaproteobacteria bacterium]|nr:UDP-glucose 4-epimerase GalE [Alphaproteobacteria bacterium]
MKKVLVTGGAGYIGSHTVVELQNAGYVPVVIDNFSNSKRLVIDQIEKITGKRPALHVIDMCDHDALKNFFANHTDISDIIHFAAFKSVGKSIEEPLEYYRNNLDSLVNLLELLQNRTVNLIFSSSCIVYGEATDLPVTESTELKEATSPYGSTKRMSERILEDVANTSSNYNIISLRYFNPVGAHASAMIGEFPLDTPQNLVPIVTQKAVGKRDDLTIYGNSYDTPDGTAMRDFIHVVDLAKAHIAALKFLERKQSATNYNIFNVGAGKGYTVFEVIKAFESSTGVKLDYKIGPRRSGDISRIYSDPSKAEKELGWKAELSIDDMMKSAWAWECYLRDNDIE